MKDRRLELLLEEAIPARVLKLLDRAHECGWEHNFTSLATRWYPNGESKYGKPWYAIWHLFYDEEKGKWRWRFAGAMASNGQKLNYNDCLTYLEHPEVIYPEPPKPTQADMVNAMWRESSK